MPPAGDLRRCFATLSLRLVSTTYSAVSFVIVTFFALVSAFSRLQRFQTFTFFSLAFGLGSYRGCGDFASSVCLVSRVAQGLLFCGGFVFVR